MYHFFIQTLKISLKHIKRYTTWTYNIIKVLRWNVNFLVAKNENEPFIISVHVYNFYKKSKNGHDECYNTSI